MRRLPVAALVLCAAGAARAQAPGVVQVAAVPEFAAVAPGGAFRVAVRLRIPEGCHIYWINPGETGLPSTIAWRTPAGVRAQGTEWPFPERDETSGMVSHVYRGEAVIATAFAVEPARQAGTVTLLAELAWALCGATCVPQRDSVAVTLPVRRGPAEPTAEWRALAPSLERLPEAGAGLSVRAIAAGDSVRLMLAGPGVRALAGRMATFFPRRRGVAVVVGVRRSGRGVAITLPGGAGHELADRVAGVLVAERPWLTGSVRRAVVVDAALEGGAAPGASRPRGGYPWPGSAASAESHGLAAGRCPARTPPVTSAERHGRPGAAE